MKIRKIENEREKSVVLFKIVNGIERHYMK
jgi:hypothetical protein